jgi:catechol 2,3-dioxygenase-like lactoylglutathione lyase family enzyme
VQEVFAVQFRLQMITVPVSDVDRAKSFYVQQLGFTLEQDVQVDADQLR